MGVPQAMDPSQMSQEQLVAYQQHLAMNGQSMQQVYGQPGSVYADAMNCVMDDVDSDDGGTRRRGRPRERKAFIQNDQERRKYFVNRVKAIRAKAETFAKCTGQDILTLTIDEEGGAHYWGTPAFER